MDVPVLQYRYRRLALTAVSLELPCLLIYPLFYTYGDVRSPDTRRRPAQLDFTVGSLEPISEGD